MLNKFSTRWLLFALGAVGVLAPGAPSQALGGVPLTVAGLLGAAGVVYATLALPSIGRRAARWLALGLAIALGLKLVAGATSPPLGLVASYWVGPAPSGSVERSTDFAWLTSATRIDPTLDLRADQFPVHFFNDAGRFNFGPDVQPGRDQLPFSVRWQGWLFVPSDGERRFVVDSTGSADVTIDDTHLASADGRLNVSAGSQSANSPVLPAPSSAYGRAEPPIWRSLARSGRGSSSDC